MKQRVITALALLALLALVIWQIYTPLFIIVVAFFSAVAANEIMKCAKIKNKFILFAGTAAGAVIPMFASPFVFEPVVSSAVWGMVTGFLPSTAYITALVIAYFIAMIADYKKTKFEDVAIAFVASVLVPYAFSVFVKLRDIEGYKTQLGIYLIFYALISALGTDTGAQLTGMAIGKHKMAPNISPKKTYEGAVGGIIAGFILNLVAMLLYNKFAAAPLDKRAMTILLAASPFVQFLSMMGDLSASVLKRNFGVKDFGKIFPGHGGVMDRFDSSMFTLPLTYALAELILR